MPWRYSLTFNPQEDFLHICSVSLVPKGVGGSEDLLILYSNRALPLSVLAINYYLDYCRDYYFKVFVEYARSFQSCPTLCDPMDYSPPGSSVHGIFQARILEWVATLTPTQGLNLCLLHCRWILYPPRYLGQETKTGY